MKLATLTIFLLFWSHGSIAKKKNKKVEPSEAVNITAWQYCEGCKLSVKLFADNSRNEMDHMQRKGIQAGSSIPADKLIEGICDKKEFDSFEMFIRYSCVKIFNDHREDFLKSFEGLSSANDYGGSALFRHKKNICVDSVQACKPEIFNKANVPVSQRTTCSACSIISHELEMAYLTSKASKKTRSVSVFLEKICQDLGSSYQPYVWLEKVCEELLEERADQIADIKKFRDKVARTGLNPSKSLSDMICDEIYLCDKEKEKKLKEPNKEREKEVPSDSADADDLEL